MKSTRVAYRYALALLEMAEQEQALESVLKDAVLLEGMISQSPDLRSFLRSPVLKSAKKAAVLRTLFEKDVAPLTMNFLLLLVDKERIRYLPVIFGIYRKLEDGLAGRLRARVVTARRIEEDQRSAIQRMMEGRFRKKVILEETEDPEILGGVICKVDGMVFDGSVRTQLEILKTRIRGE